MIYKSCDNNNNNNIYLHGQAIWNHKCYDDDDDDK